MYTSEDAKQGLRVLFGSDNPRIVDLSVEEYTFVVGYINPIIDHNDEAAIDLLDVLSDRIDILSIFDGEDGERVKNDRILEVLRALNGEGVGYGEVSGSGETVLIFDGDENIGKFNREYCRLYAPFAFAVLDKLFSEKKWWIEPRRHLGSAGDNIVVAEDLVDCAAHYDQYDWCDECGKLIETGGYVHRYHLGQWGFTCEECIRKEPEDYIDLFVNKTDEAGDEGFIDKALVDPHEHGWLPLNEIYYQLKVARLDAGELNYCNVDFVITTARSSFRAWYEIYVKEADFDRACDVLEAEHERIKTGGKHE